MSFDYFPSTNSNKTLYFGRTNSLMVQSDFLYNEGINYGVQVKAIKNCTVRGVYPVLEILPTEKPVCGVEVYFKDELKYTYYFSVIDFPLPYLTADILRDYSIETSNAFDEIIHSRMKLTDFLKIERIDAELILDGAGSRGLNFKIASFDFSVLRNKQVIFTSKNEGHDLNSEILAYKKELQPGDKILFENIFYYLNKWENEQGFENVFNYNVVELS